MTESIIALLFFLDIISFVYMIEPKSLAQFSVHSYSITIMSTFIYLFFHCMLYAFTYNVVYSLLLFI